jgi:hypothetical protein
MWMPSMKILLRGFSPKAFVIALIVSSAVAGLISWFTRANFWYALLIVLCGMLVNGWIASGEDRDGDGSGK